MMNDRSLARSDASQPQQDPDVGRTIVIIVDDDASVREALSDLILSAGLQTLAFASTRDLFAADVLSTAGCLILDVRMPGTSGLDLQQHLTRTGIARPVIFLTGHGDIPMTVQAMKAGAVDFLTKPVRPQTLLDAVIVGIRVDAARRAVAAIVNSNLARYGTLTPREKEVLERVVVGRLNKQIAFELRISEVTVKMHRGNMMRKMAVSSIGELIRAWETLAAALRDMPVLI